MIVVVVEPALAHRNRAFGYVAANRLDVAHVIEIRRVVGMDAGGMIDVPRVGRGDAGSSIGGGDRLANGYDARPHRHRERERSRRRGRHRTPHPRDARGYR